MARPLAHDQPHGKGYWQPEDAESADDVEQQDDETGEQGHPGADITVNAGCRTRCQPAQHHYRGRDQNRDGEAHEVPGAANTFGNDTVFDHDGFGGHLLMVPDQPDCQGCVVGMSHGLGAGYRACAAGASPGT